MKEHDLIKVKVSDLQFDKSNPNKLSQDQMAGLRESMKKFGYLTPIIVDQNMNIADGEHRALVYKEFGLKEIPAYQFIMNDHERKLLRQTMNKLRGRHDLNLDADEIADLHNAGLLQDLSNLIAINRDALQYVVDLHAQTMGNITDAISNTRDKLNQTFNESYEIEQDGQKTKKWLESQEEHELGEIKINVRCPKCGFEW